MQEDQPIIIPIAPKTSRKYEPIESVREKVIQRLTETIQNRENFPRADLPDDFEEKVLSRILEYINFSWELGWLRKYLTHPNISEQEQIDVLIEKSPESISIAWGMEIEEQRLSAREEISIVSKMAGISDRAMIGKLFAKDYHRDKIRDRIMESVIPALAKSARMARGTITRELEIILSEHLEDVFDDHELGFLNYDHLDGVAEGTIENLD